MRRWLWVLVGWVLVTQAQSVVTIDIHTETDIADSVAYAKLVEYVSNTVRQPVELRVFDQRQAWLLKQQGPNPVAVSYGTWPGDSRYQWTPWGSQLDQVVVLVALAHPAQGLADLAGLPVLANPVNWSSLVMKKLWPENIPLPYFGGGQGLADSVLLEHYVKWGGRAALVTSASALAGAIPKELRVVYRSPPQPTRWLGIRKNYAAQAAANVQQAFHYLNPAWDAHTDLVRALGHQPDQSGNSSVAKVISRDVIYSRISVPFGG